MLFPKPPSREPDPKLWRRVLGAANSGDLHELDAALGDCGAARPAKNAEMMAKAAFLGALSQGHLPCARRLEALAAAGEPSPTGETALMAAARSGSVECAQYALSLSEPTAQDSSGISALMIAAQEGDEQMVDWLAPRSDHWQKDSDGKTALMLAALRRFAGCVRILADAPNAALGSQDSEGRTALILSIAQGASLECASILWAHEEKELRPAGQSSPLSVALRAGNQWAALRLLSSSRWALAPCENEKTALQDALTAWDWTAADALAPLAEKTEREAIWQSHIASGRLAREALMDYQINLPADENGWAKNLPQWAGARRAEQEASILREATGAGDATSQTSGAEAKLAIRGAGFRL